MNFAKSENIYIPSLIASLLTGVSAAYFILYVSSSDLQFKSLIVVGSTISLILLSAYFFHVFKNPKASVSFIICSMWIVLFEPSICDIFISLAILAFILNNLFTYKNSIARLSFVEYMLIVYIVVNIQNVIQSNDLAYSIRFYGITLYLVILFFFISRLSDSYDMIRKQLKLYFIPCIITSFVLVVSYVAVVLNIDMGILDFLIESGRPRAFFKDPNVAGPFLIPAAIYSLAAILNNKSKYNPLLLFLFLSSVIGVFATLSRAAMASLLFSIFLVVVFSVDAKKFIKIAFILFLCLSSFTLFIYIVPQSDIADRLYDTDFGVNDRIQRIERSFNVIKENPIMGSGMYYGLGETAHDTFFLLMTHTGIIGAACFWLPVIYVSGRLLINSRSRLYEKNKVIFLTLGVSLISHMALAILIYFGHWRHFWYIFALAAAALRLTDARTSKT